MDRGRELFLEFSSLLAAIQPRWAAECREPSMALYSCCSCCHHRCRGYLSNTVDTQIASCSNADARVASMKTKCRRFHSRQCPSMKSHASWCSAREPNEALEWVMKPHHRPALRSCYHCCYLLRRKWPHLRCNIDDRPIAPAEWTVHSQKYRRAALPHAAQTCSVSWA